ncbi:MAG: SusC/RagA family TonB-linked outer membrane protein [Flavobacterium sp.]|uniref:SusC/RagA family TonB-linked outer membrane protein n=1 Tax=Flavobacterium sp. TaxID=239 RepID=UPI0037AE04E8
MRSKFKWIFTLLVAFMMQFSFAQEKTVTGVVTDELGPAVGASVVVKGTTNATTTDFDGKYSIKAKSGDVLEISFLEAKQLVTVGAASNYDVKLSQVMKEVVITTVLGQSKKADAMTSAFTKVSAAEMATAANPNAVRSLAGKVAGLQINNSSNGVNGNSTINLRTSVSFSKSNEALVVIDGVPSSASVFAAMAPNMIESVNVLKGPQGAALYGSQGVNGVLVVTTKKGSKGSKVSINFNSAIDFESISFVPEKQMRYGQGWDGVWDPYENGGWGELYDGSIRQVGLIQPDGTYIQSAYSPIKDNLKQFYKDGTILQNGINVRIGGENSYASFAADNQMRDFMVKGDEYKRSNFIFRAGTSGEKWSLDGIFNYRVSKTNQSDTGTTLLELQQAAANIPIGRFDNGSGLGGWTVYYNNPFWRRDNNRFSNEVDYFNTSLTAAYKLTKNIELKYNGGVQSTNSEQVSTRNELVEDPNSPDPLVGSLGQTSAFYKSVSNNRYYYGDFMASFNYDLTDNVSLKALVGHNMQKTDFYRISQGGENLEIPGWYHINNVLNPDTPSNLRNSTATNHQTAEFFSADLGYKDYLFLNLTGRYEHTSLLLKNNRDFFYPSAGLSYIVSKHKDLSSAKINYLKVYGNFTQVGSVDAVNTYEVLSFGQLTGGFPFALTGNSFNDPYSQVDPKIKPEYYTTFEAGFTVGAFDDRLTLDAAAFMTKTTDAISNISTAPSSGLLNFKTNIGEVETKGVEFTLGFVPVKTENFKWNGNFVFSTYSNEVTKLAPGQDRVTLYDTPSFDGSIVAALGESFPYLYGSDWLRDDQGRVIINAAGSPTVNPTQVKLGKVNPDYTMGLTNTFAYKNIALAFTVDYREGGKLFSESKYNMTWSGHAVDTGNYDRDLGFIYPNSVLEDGTPNTTVYTAAGQVASRVYGGNLASLGSYGVIDGSFIKVREIALSYSLPSKYTDKLGISSMKFSVNARNPFVYLSKENKGYADPESNNIFDVSNSNGARTAAINNNPVATGFSQVSQYPTSKTFGFSLNVGF